MSGEGREVRQIANYNLELKQFRGTTSSSAILLLLSPLDVSNALRECRRAGPSTRFRCRRCRTTWRSRPRIRVTFYLLSAAVAAQSADGELAPDSRREKVNTTEADRYLIDASSIVTSLEPWRKITVMILPYNHVLAVKAYSRNLSPDLFAIRVKSIYRARLKGGG